MKIALKILVLVIFITVLGHVRLDVATGLYPPALWDVGVTDAVLLAVASVFLFWNTDER